MFVTETSLITNGESVVVTVIASADELFNLIVMVLSVLMFTVLAVVMLLKAAAEVASVATLKSVVPVLTLNSALSYPPPVVADDGSVTVATLRYSIPLTVSVTAETASAGSVYFFSDICVI